MKTNSFIITSYQKELASALSDKISQKRNELGLSIRMITINGDGDIVNPLLVILLGLIKSVR